MTKALLPDIWIRETTGEVPWEKQTKILRALAVDRRVGVASANSCGKSWLAARAASWWLTNFEPSVVVTTAPTDRQVRRILWKEIHKSVNKAEDRGNYLGGKLLTKSWQFSEEHFGIGFSTRDYDPDAFQGLHSEHILVIVDEAAGVSEQIFDGVISILRGKHSKLLIIGNPTSLSGFFYEAFKTDGWWTTHISAFDSPNLQGKGIVIPGLITEQDVEDARKDWGEGSFLWQAKIEGKFPDKIENTLIALNWIEVAANQEFKDSENDVEVGADIARYGNDSSIFIARCGGNAFSSEEHNKFDLMEISGKLIKFAKINKAKKIKIDGVGLGAGVFDRVSEVLSSQDDIEVIEFSAGKRAEDSDVYYNMGTEAWAELAKGLKAKKIGGAVFGNKKLMSELTNRRYKFKSDGKMILESKEEIKKRGGKSPDWGDAVTIAFYEGGDPFEVLIARA